MPPAQQITSVAIEFWQLIVFIVGILVAFATMVWAFSKMFISQLDKRFDERNKKLDEHGDKIAAVDREILLLRAELPQHYVQREDWIRFSSTMDTKLDWLREKVDGTAREILSKIKSQGTKEDGR